MKNSIKLVLSIFAMVFLNFNASVFAQNPGQVDTSFNASTAGVPGTVRVVFPTNDGKLLVASGNYPNDVFYRLHANGSLDYSFNNFSHRGNIMGIDTTDDGSIFITVNSNSVSFPNGLSGAGTFLLSNDNNTVLDSTELYYNFNSYFESNTVKFISYTEFPILYSQGVVLYGYTKGNYSFIDVKDLSSMNISTINSISLPQYTFIKTINVSANGKLYVGTNKGIYRYTLSAGVGTVLNSDDIAFNNTIPVTLDVVLNQCDISAIDFQSGSNTILIGGTFKINTLSSIQKICRLNNDGTLDGTFNIPSFSNGSINNITLTNSNKIFCVGAYGFPNFVMGLNSDGTPDVIFNSNLSGGISIGNVKASCKTKTGNLIAAGQFSSCGGVSASNIVSLFGPDNTASGLNICIVTVDTLLGKNMIVWEKSSSTSIVSYNLYKENGTGIYDSIGNVDYNAFSTFIDSTSDPLVQSDRYKISAVETNGNVTPLSSAVKSIHLSVSVGASGENNLFWDGSEGFSFSRYYIYRSTNGSTYVLLDSTSSSTIISYTDIVPPIGTNFYVVQARNNFGCVPSFNLLPTNYNESFSNRLTVVSTGLQHVNESFVNDVRVYPNPANSGQIVTFQFNLLNNSNVTIQLIDITGKIVKNVLNNIPMTNGFYKNDIDISNVKSGLYFVSVLTGNGKSQFKLIVQ